jgi:hypothetical protein
MVSRELIDVLRQAEQLPPAEQLELIARLAGHLQSAHGDDLKPRRRRSWLEIAGSAPYPLLGEDAQDWVTRTRHEGDEHREQLLKQARTPGAK